MNLTLILAAATQPTQPNPTGELMRMLGTFALLGVMFYFVFFRPQQKKAKEHAQLLKTLRPGDKIMTSGGLLGVVITVKEKSATIRSADSKMEVTKTAITEIIERSGESSES